MGKGKGKGEGVGLKGVCSCNGGRERLVGVYWGRGEECKRGRGERKDSE